MFFSKIKESFSNKINNIFGNNKELNEIIDDIEETLIFSDVGAETAMNICDSLRKKMKNEADKSENNIKECLRGELINIIMQGEEDSEEKTDYIHSNKKCIMVVGVNGVGKTTSIAKLANIYLKEGKKILLVAGDTFRAGAIEQLNVWADRLGVECVSGQDGADPSSVMFDGTKRFSEGDYDIVICDTAGRLHNKSNLMQELEKMKRTISKNVSEENIEVYMVLDSTTGQNGVMQAKAFYETTDIDGIILTKLDSTSKGGVVFSIVNELHIPIKYIGTGETVDDIEKFNPRDFVESII